MANIAIIHKTEKIIPFLDELSDEAMAIGAINCISIKNGKTKGFNTDAIGFEKTLLLHKKENQKSNEIFWTKAIVKTPNIIN